MYQNGDPSKGTLTLQVGANSSAAGLDFDGDLAFSAAVAGADKVGKLALGTASGAAAVITAMDAMIAQVDEQRADLGAIQNRLESSIRNQSNVSLNEADARSRIRDTDFAEEAANLSQQTIIQQAATSMLMQANTRPQLALSMLG